MIRQLAERAARLCGVAALHVAYYTVLTPVGAVLGVVRDPLHRRIKPRRSTYWEPSTPRRSATSTGH